MRLVIAAESLQIFGSEIENMHRRKGERMEKGGMSYTISTIAQPIY